MDRLHSFQSGCVLRLAAAAVVLSAILLHSGSASAQHDSTCFDEDHAQVAQCNGCDGVDMRSLAEAVFENSLSQSSHLEFGVWNEQDDSYLSLRRTPRLSDLGPAFFRPTPAPLEAFVTRAGELSEAYPVYGSRDINGDCVSFRDRINDPDLVVPHPPPVPPPTSDTWISGGYWDRQCSTGTACTGSGDDAVCSSVTYCVLIFNP